MNCKPGDLAIVVHSKRSDRIGVIVKVLGPTIDSEPGWWTVESPNHPPPTIGGWKARDAWLRPIRPQPDNAIDQMVERVGKPNEVTA